MNSLGCDCGWSLASPFFQAQFSSLSSNFVRCSVSVICCYRTDHLKTQWPKAITISFALLLQVSNFDWSQLGSSVGLTLAHSYDCSHLEPWSDWMVYDGLIHQLEVERLLAEAPGFSPPCDSAGLLGLYHVLRVIAAAKRRQNTNMQALFSLLLIHIF